MSQSKQKQAVLTEGPGGNGKVAVGAQVTLTEAQTKHLRMLMFNSQTSQLKVKEFVQYLYDEHGLKGKWGVSPDLTTLTRIE